MSRKCPHPILRCSNLGGQLDVDGKWCCRYRCQLEFHQRCRCRSSCGGRRRWQRLHPVENEEKRGEEAEWKKGLFGIAIKAVLKWKLDNPRTFCQMNKPVKSKASVLSKESEFAVNKNRKQEGSLSKQSDIFKVKYLKSIELQKHFGFEGTMFT